MTEIMNFAENDIFVIKVSGEVDASSSILLDEQMTEGIDQAFKKIMVDCTDLNYISSAGLGVFMSYLQELENQNIKLVLYGLNEKVMNVFQILGLNELIKIVESKEKAKSLIDAI